MKITSYKKDKKTYYKFNVYLGVDDNGKELRTNRQGFTSKKDAEIEYLRLKEVGLDKTVRITLDTAYQEWLKSYELTVRASTLGKTKQEYNNHIKPVFG